MMNIVLCVFHVLHMSKTEEASQSTAVDPVVIYPLCFVQIRTVLNEGLHAIAFSMEAK